MKRFRFALETLLRLQKQRQRLAELQQAHAFRQWWEACQQLLALNEHTCALGKSVSERLHLQTTLSAISSQPPSVPQTINAYWFLLGEHVAVLQMIEQMARAHESQHRQIWEQRQQERLAVSRQVEMLELLRQQALANFRRELGLYEQRVLDETAMRMWWRHDTNELSLEFASSLYDPARSFFTAPRQESEASS